MRFWLTMVQVVSTPSITISVTRTPPHNCPKTFGFPRTTEGQKVAEAFWFDWNPPLKKKIYLDNISALDAFHTLYYITIKIN